MINLYAETFDGHDWEVIEVTSFPDSMKIDVLLRDTEGNMRREWAKNLNFYTKTQNSIEG